MKQGYIAECSQTRDFEKSETEAGDIVLCEALLEQNFLGIYFLILKYSSPHHDFVINLLLTTRAPLWG